jgi:branched-chain amino acid transport system permease protein
MQLFTGLSLGMLYVLLALGLSIIFGLLTVVNFAHACRWGGAELQFAITGNSGSL